MPPIHIFWPVTALAFWTLGVLLLLPFVRVRAFRRREVCVADFALGESDAVPERVRLPNRNLMNLLEMPVLFYAGCLVLYVTGGASYLATVFAWIYVVARIAHSLIHLTANRVPLRLAAFAASNLVLAALWVMVALHLARAGGAGM